jgi:iron(III) transport system substrate-binding protein
MSKSPTRSVRTLGAGLGLSLVLAACGGSEESSDTSAEGTPAETVSGCDGWDADAPAEWQEILDAAEKEGEVVLAGPGYLGDALTEGFESSTGLTLSYLGGSSRELNSRYEQEIQADNLTIDIMLGGGTGLNKLLPEGHLESIRPQLILPSTADEHWKSGEQKYLDNAGEYLLQGTEWVFATVLVNPDSLGDVEVRTWDDLLDPALKGRIAAYDPRTGGPGQAVAAYAAEVKGMDYAVDLYDGHEVVMTQDGTQLVEWVARGTYDVGLAALAPDIERYRTEGLPLEVRSMEDGPGALVGSFSVLMQAKGAPHPNATQVFNNWWASGCGLDIYARTMMEPSLRKDSEVEAPEYLVPEQGVEYIDQYSEDWYTRVRPVVTAELAEALGR